MKPYIGQLFPTIDECNVLYLIYAKLSGFVVRSGTNTKSTDGTSTTVWKYFLCNRQGFIGACKPEKSSSSKRKRNTDRCGCPAILKLRYEGNRGYRVMKFEERHNHPHGSSRSKTFLE